MLIVCERYIHVFIIFCLKVSWDHLFGILILYDVAYFSDKLFSPLYTGSFKVNKLELEERKIILLQELRTDKNPHCSKKCISSFQHNENGAVRKHLY